MKQLREIEIANNPKLVENIKVRSRLNLETRLYFAQGDYIETETPLITPETGIGPSRVFVTYEPKQVFLRTTDTDYLRRLLVGGFDSTFQLSKHFRKSDNNHKSYPEFTQLSIAKRGINYKELMYIVKDYMAEMAKILNGSTSVDAFGQTIDLSHNWTELPVREAIEKYVGLDVDRNLTPNELKSSMLEKGITLPTGADKFTGILKYTILMEHLLDTFVIPNYKGALFLTEYPSQLGGPGMEVDGKSEYKQRGEVFFNGIELVNSVSSQTNGKKLRDVYEDTLYHELNSGQFEGKKLDEEYMQSMALGMPPSAAMSIGYDRFLMMLTSSKDIKDVITFPIFSLREEKK